MYYHQKDVYTSSAQPVESNYEYHNSNDNGYVGMNQAYEQRHVQTSQRFTGVQNGPPVTRTQESGGYNGNSYGNEFVMSRTSNFKSSSGVPENMQVVDSQVTSKRYVPPRNDRKSTTKVVTETLDDGTVISRQIVVEEEDTLIERRLYKYEATSPHMNRKLDPAQAMAVQTGIHQAAEYGEDEDELTDKFSRYEAELEARRRLQRNGGHSGSNPGGMDSEDGRISPQVDSTTVRAAPRSLKYNESFKHASNEGLFPNAYEGNESSPRNKAAQPMIMHGRNNNDSPSMSSNYTYDLPGGTDFNRRQNGHTTIRVTETTTTHGFPLLSGGNRQKSTPDVSRNVDSDYVANYDNTNLVAKQRGFKMSADNLVDEDVMVVRETKLQQHSAGGDMMDFTPKPSPKPKVLPTQRYAGPPQSGSSNKFTDMVLEKSCGRCLERLQPGQELVTSGSGGEILHQECFVCAACFRPFPNGVYYDFDNRKYCEEDFNLLFAPSCMACGHFVKGRVIKAMGGKSWHSDCFTCARCETPLADIGFHSVKSHPDKAYCKPCSEYMMMLESGKRFCGKCHAQIEQDGLRFKDEWFHAYHFHCNKCNAELTQTARESDGQLYCLKCSDSKTCALCRRTIEKYERSLLALNKTWHPDCFRCSFCDKPFNGDKHFVYNAQPYCEEHYNQLFGNLCFYCNRIVPAPGVTIEQKIRKYCDHHFECFFCSKPLQPNTDVCMLDARPVCMKCTQRFPGDFKQQCFKSRGMNMSGSLNPKVKLLNPFKKK